MAQSAETINTRIKNLRSDAEAAARAALTHANRLGLALERFTTAVDDLEMYAGNRKAARSEDEEAADAKLVEVSAKIEKGDHATALSILGDLFAAAEPERAEAPAEPKVAADAAETEQPRRTRKVKDAPQA